MITVAGVHARPQNRSHDADKRAREAAAEARRRRGWGSSQWAQNRGRRREGLHETDEYELLLCGNMESAAEHSGGGLKTKAKWEMG